MLRQRQNGNGRITGARRLMDGGSIPPSSTINQFHLYVTLNRPSSAN